VYHCFIHFDIQDDKIWIQRNMTEADLAQELLDLDVPKEDIVLGLHPPYKRPYTGYGVA
jgi:XisI protein